MFHHRTPSITEVGVIGLVYGWGRSRGHTFSVAIAGAAA